MILSAQSIRKRCLNVDPPLITPFRERTVSEGYSGGLSCHGYDLHLDQDVILYPICRLNENTAFYGQTHFKLASTVEKFHMPLDLMGHVMGKSSMVRQGISVDNTCIEAGWSGFLTLEIFYHGTKPMSLNKGTPIAQVVFHLLDEPTEQPYVGKYQSQHAGPQPAILEK